MKIDRKGIHFGSIENIDKKQNDRDVITNKITEQQLFREVEDIKKWREAITSAESATTPNRTPLQRIYKDVKLDTHVTSVINTRINKLLANEWKIYDTNGDVDVEATKLLDKKWFTETRVLINEALYYGYSLIQFGAIVDDEFSSVSLVPRENTVPEYNSIKKIQGIPSATDLVSFIDKPYDLWNAFIDTKDFGLLNNCAPFAIYKKNAASFWGRYLQLFGMPIRIGKTDVADTARRTNMSKMLKNMASAAWGVFDKNDEIDLVQSSGSIGNPVYKENIELANKEISKAILGQTMTTEDGSSQSQANVHERVGDIYTMSDKIFETNIMNYTILPLLVKHGIIKEGLKFNHEFVENISPKEKVNMIKEMTNAGYIFDQTFVEDFTGLKIEGTQQKDTSNVTENYLKVKNLYE